MDLEANNRQDEEPGSQMSFLEHLDEVRRRLINSILIIILALGVCYYFSGKIYNFLAVPVVRAMGDAQRREIPVEGLTGDEKVLPLSNLPEGETGRYVFDRATTLGATVVASGTSVQSIVARDINGNIGLFTNEPIYTGNFIIPKGIKLPVNLNQPKIDEPSADERMVVTTATEGFTLFITVSLYAAIALSMPFLLWQVWGFISPALYKHERTYVTPFIVLSSISFVIGAAFAYYVLVPPALSYLLGLSEDFRLMLRATDYFDFITIVILAMGIIFQMPAITYVLSRIGIVTAGFLIKSWKVAIVVILIVAAVISPTGDIPNLMLFATPMMFLYLISIFVAWFFGKKRTSEEF
jgi:sec-independent protein translocase protein TatC